MEEFIIVNGRRKYKHTCLKCNAIFFRRTDIKNKNLCTSCTRKNSSILNTHRKSRTRIYERWSGIKSRCYGDASQKHRDYKKRGITICDEWLNDFMSFYNWAIENGYREDLTIDRINNDGNYEPSNCRWITNKEQQLNKRELISTNKSGHKYISFNKKRNSWRLSVGSESIKINKYFKNIEDAIIFKNKILKDKCEI